jgi:hypothetical protein
MPAILLCKFNFPFLQPSFLLAVAGLATLVHYNDERRAVPLGTQNLFAELELYVSSYTF